MLICDECGWVFDEPIKVTDPDNGDVYVCPSCKSDIIMDAVECENCGRYVEEDSVFGYEHHVCEDCVMNAGYDFPLLLNATLDDVSGYELPTLFRYVFSKWDIEEILMRELKTADKYRKADTSTFVTAHANEIADEIINRELYDDE